MGRKRVVVAVLLEHSVKVAMSMQIRKAIAKSGTFFRGSRVCPSHRDSPDVCVEKHHGMSIFSRVHNKMQCC